MNEAGRSTGTGDVETSHGAYESRRRTYGASTNRPDAGLVVAAALVLSACLPPTPAGARRRRRPASTVPAGATGTDSRRRPGGTARATAGITRAPTRSARPYRGVAVCGPRPGADHTPDRLVRFYTGAWGEQEWECVELAMRFMYLAYGVSPYNANGKDVYTNYTTAAGGGLVKIADGTPGSAACAR